MSYPAPTATRPSTTRPRPAADPADRLSLSHSEVLPFPPERVFPLLCPTREYDWIRDWACDLRYSASGVAELDAVFVTELPDRVVWTVSRYEPPAEAGGSGRIGFVLFDAPSLVVRLAVTVEPAPEGSCRIGWTRVYTAVDAAGRRKLAAVDPDGFVAKHRELNRLLVHYLRHGEAWRPEAEGA